MKHLVLLFLAMLVATSLMADRRLPAERIDTGSPAFDSLLLLLNQRVNDFTDDNFGKLDIVTYVQGVSTNQKTSRMVHFLQDFIPYETREGRITAVEGLCKVSYQFPCDLQIYPIAYEPSGRRARKVLREVNQALLPIYTLRRMKDKSSDKSYVIPFSDDGLLQYNYTLTDTLLPTPDSTLYVIHFAPKRKHHTLLEGDVIIDMQDEMYPTELRFDGRIDFGHISDTLQFGWQDGQRVVTRNRIGLRYHYGPSRGTNNFDCVFDYRQIVPFSQFDLQSEPLDLTNVYQDELTRSLNFDTIRVIPLPDVIDSLLTPVSSSPQPTTRRQQFYRQLPKYLLGTQNVNAFGSSMRFYGPLHPATVGYDKRNGITLRQRLRFNRQLSHDQSFFNQTEAGFSFGRKEFRYKVDNQWIYAPHRRAGLRLLFQNSPSGFSSKFKESVDNRLEQQKVWFDPNSKEPWKSGVKFDDLGISYYNRYEFRLEHSLELCNGLMGYAGASYNYRRPRRHGTNAMSQEAIDQLVDKFYADLNPFLRLSWTPRQYYHYYRGQKMYLASLYPTFNLEVAQGIYGFCGSTSNYSRIEFDAAQTISIDSYRSVYWHAGSGAFSRQRGEYFINYNYFSKSQYPSTWDKETHGGVFSLLDEHWYSSSPAYFQTHVMYESPFLFLHLLRPISQYVIKERIYLSHLLASGKNAYTEIGYGMGNNYFNVGCFCGFIGLQFMDVGLKFSLEIGEHL